MAKVDILLLRKIIGREEFDHVALASALSPYQAIDQKINSLLKAGDIVRIKKGLYVFGENSRQTAICKESLANLIYGPSCISLEYALSFHGLIPERVHTVTSVNAKRYKEFNTPIGQFTYTYLSGNKYPHGVEQHWIDKIHPVFMASPEKALCDYVMLKGVPEIHTKNEAIKFLSEDLRIDQEDWKRFDLKELLFLNSHYRSKSVHKIMEAL